MNYNIFNIYIFWLLSTIIATHSEVYLYNINYTLFNIILYNLV